MNVGQEVDIKFIRIAKNGEQEESEIRSTKQWLHQEVAVLKVGAR